MNARRPGRRAFSSYPMRALVGTILIVEDNRALAGAIAGLLRTVGYAVRVVHDGPEALSEAAHSLPDAVVLDLNLRSMDGLEVARQLRQDYGRRLRMIANTGRSDDTTRREAADAGFDDLLVKPTSIYQILNAIKHGGGRASA
jgi:CheY-like chemotaxis protein